MRSFNYSRYLHIFRTDTALYLTTQTDVSNILHDALEDDSWR
jgi:hypothetical protein